MKIALVTDKNTATAFRLAGLRNVHPVKSAQDAESLVKELMKEPDLAIILISERFVDQIRTTIENTERKYPELIPYPDTMGPATVKTDFIVELIRRKAGIEVKL